MTLETNIWDEDYLASEALIPFTDLTRPGTVEVNVNSVTGVMHVNINGVCVLRTNKCTKFVVVVDSVDMSPQDDIYMTRNCR